MSETYFAHAIEKGIDSQPRKTNIVASLVRDRYVADAVVILENTPRRAAKAVRKAIESAAANLMNNSGVSIDPKTMRIARISVTAGTRMRRYVPASRGRALPFEKISSNIFVLYDKDQYIIASIVLGEAQGSVENYAVILDAPTSEERLARELEERTARANERLVGELIPVFDHFELALQSAPAGDAFAQGVRMIADEFRKVLERSGAEVIDASAEGTTFDPMAHEALSAVPHATVPKDCVVSQFRKGWRLGGKVLRPAQVVVSSGAPEAPQAGEEA